MNSRETILIIDFGSQYTPLITRRVRESNVYSEVHPHIVYLSLLKDINLKGIILSGGPTSVYDDDAPQLNHGLLKLNVPVLGICYGLQVLCKSAGGKVEAAKDRENVKSNPQLVKDFS